MMLRLKNALRLFAARTFLWLLQHRTLSIVFSTLLMFILFVFFAPSTPISEILAYFLWVEYLFGMFHYVLQAVEKIENTKGNPDLAQITILECELAKKDLNILLPVMGMISGIGLATMVFNPYQTALPTSSIIVLGMIIEVMTATTFALLYWWFFFFLMERYTPERAAFWAAMISVFPFLLGSYTTVSIALFFDLNILQDFVAAFLPFLVVYHWMSKSIPDYTLSAPRSFDAEISKIDPEIKSIEKELEVEAVEERKTRLEIKLSKLNVKKKKLEVAMKWFGIGYGEVRELQKDFVDFHKQMRASRHTYLSKVRSLAKKKIGFLIDNELFVAEKISRFSFCLTQREASISDKTFESIVNVLSLREVAVRTDRIMRIIWHRTPEIFKMLQRNRTNIAIQESSTHDMPEPCRGFDRRTLEEYLPAKARFEVNQAKYRMLLYHMSKYPCSVTCERFEETQANLLLSINELRKRIQERIDEYLLLERNYPDCYVVKSFNFFFGWFGVTALQDFLRGLDIQELTISKRREQIEKLKGAIKIISSS